MDGMSTLQLGGHIKVPRKPLHKFSKIFLNTPALWWVMEQEFVFERIYGGETNLYVHNILAKNIPISISLASSFPVLRT